MPDTDVCIVNAHVLTMNPMRDSATAFRFRDGLIVAVGNREDVVTEIEEKTRIVDARGATVIPGLIDAHAHLEMLAYAWEIAIDVRSTRVSSVTEIVEVLRGAATDAPEGEWILGQGEHYQHLRLAEGVYPDRHDLDRASTSHPLIYRASYHINVFNTRALELLGVNRYTPDAPGGRIERDPNTGEATGRTFDMYAALDGPQVPIPILAEALRKTEDRYLAAGITAVGDIQLHTHALSSLLENATQHPPRLRMVAYPKLPTVVSAEDIASGALMKRFTNFDPSHLALGGIKLFLDGGLTSSAAALQEDYPGRPGYRGELAYSDDELRSLVNLADSSGVQIAMHAIGDRALDQAIEAIEALPPERRGAIRHRIEHAGNMFMTEDRINRMVSASIVPIPQPAFLLTTAVGYVDHLGAARIGRVMPFRSLIDVGLPIPGNSDAIGITADQHVPFPAMQAAIDRRASNGDLLNPEEAITPMEALAMYTGWAAHSIGMERLIGSIEIGKRADFVVLSDDPTSVSTNKIGRVEATSTWVDGTEVYSPATPIRRGFDGTGVMTDTSYRRSR